MSLTGRIIGVTAGAAAAAAVGGAARTAVHVRRRAGLLASRPLDDTPFGTLRSSGRTVVTEDGVPLHVEVDEVGEGGLDADSLAPDDSGTTYEGVTLVFVHGFTLNLDCWHFQRAAFRGRVRSVYYDQRSHGRSGRSDVGDATIEQLGEDLLQVLDTVVPDGPVILIGHSMGGMTIVALAEQHPELFAPLSHGGRIVGTALIGTTAGGLDTGRLLIPMLPAKLSRPVAHRAIGTLRRGHRAVDGVRRIGRTAATIATDSFAFGDPVPQAYVEFVDDMIASTPFDVVAEFFPAFGTLDKFEAVEAFGRIPTTIICGTADRLTSIGHSRKLKSRIPGAVLVECEGAGHMVLLERYARVNAALEELLATATSSAESA